ncbi:Lrp/AsnC family transcriptional regulator [Yinghuangia seranimata]|uniref:Lrp/AsnC family transcriptional regulator n=1 Tax=Yinghuangia seranimata TaxID=408067 RepID=UPI00248B1EFC|nr:Lrp/AsnC family transcriptional regulator [Yinghuangia seranimata]MDI2130113.1 Lrp/AsnC family transcriptional regulator [Yinghuangia seranimata]
MPDSVTDSPAGPVAVDELDLAVIQAVERSPRASWAVIGAAVGVDPTTAARRWELMERSGTAWVTCYPVLVTSLAVAIVELACTPATALATAEKIARDPQAQFVDVVTGTGNVLATVVTDGMAPMSTYILGRLGTTPGVTAIHTHPVLTVHSEGTHIGHAALDKAALTRLPEPDHGRITGASDGIDDLDRALCLVLSRDGRRPLSALGRDLDVSEATVRRRLAKLTKLRALRMMVEVAAAQTSTPLTAWYTARTPVHALTTAAATITGMPNIKAVTLVAGPNNLVFKAVFRDLADIHRFDTRLNRLLPDLETTDRKVVLRPVRLMSRLVDPDGYAREIVSIDIRGR